MADLDRPVGKVESVSEDGTVIIKMDNIPFNRSIKSILLPVLWSPNQYSGVIKIDSIPDHLKRYYHLSDQTETNSDE